MEQVKEELESQNADAKAEMELQELHVAEQMAEQQVAEALQAQGRMEKERDEMLAWEKKASRYRQNLEKVCQAHTHMRGRAHARAHAGLTVQAKD